jgi:hypothetical protein
MIFGEKTNYTCGIENKKVFPNFASKISLQIIQYSHFPVYGHQ